MASANAPRYHLWWLAVPYLLLVLALIVIPFIATLHKSLSASHGVAFTLLSNPSAAIAEPATAANYLAILEEERGRKLVGTTLILAAAVATLLSAIALFAGYFMARSTRWSQIVNAIVTFPSLAPAVTIVFGILWLFGPTGPINQLLWKVLGISSMPIEFTGTMLAVILGDMALFSTIAVRLVAAVFESIDPALEAVASSLGASDTQIFRLVLLPLVLPGLAAAWIFVFIRTMAAYVAALVLGGGTQGIVVIPLEIFMEINSLGTTGTIGKAAALAVTLVVTTLVGRIVFLALMRRFFRERLGTELL